MNSLNEFIQSPLFCLTLTAGCYLVGLKVYRITRGFPLLHPVIVAVLPLLLVLHCVDLDFDKYLQGTALLQLLLGTATVALAVPLYQQLSLIRAHAFPIACTLVLGATFAPVVALLLAWLSGATEVTLLSVSAKSVTTPIAMAIAETMGGLAEVAAGTVILAGIFGAVAGPFVFDLLSIKNQAVRGFALGLTAHAAGTARAFECGQVCGAFASLGLAMTGAFTAVAMPLVWEIIKTVID